MGKSCLDAVYEKLCLTDLSDPVIKLQAIIFIERNAVCFKLAEKHGNLLSYFIDLLFAVRKDLYLRPVIAGKNILIVVALVDPAVLFCERELQVIEHVSEISRYENIRE